MSPIAAAGLPSRTKTFQRAQNYLRGAGAIDREDSDDELGSEDHPWEWIFDHDGTYAAPHTGLQFGGHKTIRPSGVQSPLLATSPSLKTQAKSQRIVGARMGSFQCMIGDCALLKAEGTKEAWVGLICEFYEKQHPDDGKIAKFMWFSTEKEIRNKDKKRTDYLQNELYITPSWDDNPLASINGKASIVSPAVFYSKYPSGRIPRNSKDFGKIFICRRGCNTRTATYTDEFIWEEIFHSTEEDLQALIERVQHETRAARKRKRSYVAHTQMETCTEDEIEAWEPRTPRKRQKPLLISTPNVKSSAQAARKLMTPTHKRAVIKKSLEFTPLGTRIISPSVYQKSPFQVARTKLHVASVPTALPCREQEFSMVYSQLETAISEGSGSCIYISGTPGTGKTATVREVVAHLNASVIAEELDDFIFVEINGMKVTDPHQAYSSLWEALRGDRVSPSHALDLLEHEFSNPSPRRIPCVVLMDELDQLVTKSQSVMYNFFNWPGLRHSRLIVLAVANTMDLPERTLSNKISSRLGLTRITFSGYTHDQLIKIIQSRLEGVPGGIVEPDAIQFASRKVAAVSGDARRALEICRRAVEIAESQALYNNAVTEKLSQKGRGSNTPSRFFEKKLGKVTISTIKHAIQEATSSPLQQCLKSLPLASKLLLAAIVARTRRSGVRESVISEVFEEAKRISHMARSANAYSFLLTDAVSAFDGSNPMKQVTSSRIPRVIAMSAAVTNLMEAGVVGLEPRKGERSGRIRLNVGEDEIKLALRDDSEACGLGFSA